MADRRQRRRQGLFRLAVFVAITWALGATAIQQRWLEDIEHRTWDWRLRYVAKSEVADPSIKIILIDQSSLEHFAQQEAVVWPWPRGMYAAVAEYLRDAGARAVAFDILFTEPSSYGVEDDEAFAASMQGPMPVVAAAALRQSRQTKTDGIQFNEFRRFQERRRVSAEVNRMLPESEALPLFAGIELPVLELWAAMGGLGNVSASPDSDGIYRHVRPAGSVDRVPILGLPFALYRAAYPEGIALDALAGMFDRHGRLAVRFKGAARRYATYGIDSIILSQRQREEGKEPFVPLSHFQDAIVFVGMDAPGLLDLRPTPLSQIFPGVEYNATVLDNLLHGNFMRRVGLWENWGLLAAALIACAAVVLLGAPVLVQGVVISAVLIVYSFGSFVAAQYGYWIELAVPMVGSVLATLIALGLQYQAEGRERKFLRTAFQQYVSGNVIEKILANPDALSLGGERRELTMFFSDIAGFTSISEKLLPDQVGKLLNTFLSEMSAIILKHGGTLDKYVGDAIVAFWNAPVAVPDHAERAVRAALECQERIAECSERWKEEFGAEIKMRIGLNTGEVSVGNFGSSSRFNYTMIGDAANLASRLEGANKKFGTDILIAASTAERIAAAALKVRRVGALRVVGKNEPVQVFEPLGMQHKPDLSDAISHFDSGEIEKAKQKFEAHRSDSLARAYLGRIDSEVRAGFGTDRFNPVWELSEK